ncbi:MAG: hypothetical protein WBL74_10950 [Novosphingobium sp.]|uniref:hypothetical protein n=1 Tax=Novosphingobium sp. TaxID=1874826 RepID=UPI003C7E6DFC
MTRLQIVSISAPLAAAAMMLLPGCTTGNSRPLDNGQKLSQRGESVSSRGTDWTAGHKEMASGQKLIAKSDKKLADGRKKLRDADDEAAKAQRQIDDANADRVRGDQMVAGLSQPMNIVAGQKLIAQSERNLADGRKKLHDANEDAVKAQRQIDEANANRIRGDQMIARGTEKMTRAEADYQQIRNDGPAIQPR